MDLLIHRMCAFLTLQNNDNLVSNVAASNSAPIKHCIKIPINLGIVRVLNFLILNIKWCFTVILIFISLRLSIFPSVNWLFGILSWIICLYILSIPLVVVLSLMHSSYIIDSKPMPFLNAFQVFSPSLWCFTFNGVF